MPSSPSPTPADSPAYCNRWRSWADPTNTYASVIDPVTVRIAAELVQLADALLPMATTPGARALDLGTGTGALARTLRERFPHLPVVATDISPHMIARLRRAAAGHQPMLLQTGVMDMREPFSMQTVDGAGSETMVRLRDGSFSHVFCSVAVQVLPAGEAEAALALYRRLLRPGGVLAVSVWEQDETKLGPILIWGQAARKVKPDYENPPAFEKGEWEGREDLVRGLRKTGFVEVSAAEVDVGFNVGTEKYLDWWWESGHPMPARRLGDFEGDLEEAKVQMRALLDGTYEGGLRIPLKFGIAAGRCPRGSEGSSIEEEKGDGGQ